MSRIAYVNGRYLPHAAASVHVEDRGFQFADGVYEVIGVAGGTLIDETPHLDRLERSLAELAMPRPMSRRALRLVLREVVRRNRVRDGSVYLQVTRGKAPRDFAFPSGSEPSLVVTARSLPPGRGETLAERGVAVATMPDLRWRRCDIKSVSLLPAVLAKQAAKAKGAFEAWLVDAEGNVTEGASSNAWIVDAQGRLLTRHLDAAVLAGITRQVLLDLAREEGREVLERRFSVAEAMNAAEAFITSTTSFVLPVVRIDAHPVGDGRPGPVAQGLRERYRRRMQAFEPD